MAGDVLPLNLLEPGEQPVPYTTGNQYYAKAYVAILQTWTS